MSKRYSSKQQETFFQPWRVRLGPQYETDGHYHHRYISRYHIVKQNQITHEYEDLGCELTKAAAIETAKYQAQALGLPFDLKADVLKNLNEIVKGPLHQCLLCERKEHRHEPFVCDRCKEIHVDGLATRQDRIRCAVSESDLPPHTPSMFEYRRRDWFKSALWRFVRMLTGNEEPGSTYGYYQTRESLRRLLGLRAEHGGSVLHLTEHQIVALEEFCGDDGVLAEAAQQWYKQGVRDGSDLLGRLAAGEIHPETFQLEREPKPEEKPE